MTSLAIARLLAALSLTVVLALALGCGQSNEAPAEVPLDQASSSVKAAFAQSTDNLKQAADAAAEGMASGDYLGSYGRLGELSSQPDLTPEQRQALAESQIAVMKKISEAAASGDENAAKTLEVHRARK